MPRQNDYYRGRSPRNASQTLLERLLATGLISEEMIQMDKGKAYPIRPISTRMGGSETSRRGEVLVLVNSYRRGKDFSQHRFVEGRVVVKRLDQQKDEPVLSTTPGLRCAL